MICVVSATSALPPLTASNITVDGYTQPGAKANTHALKAGDNEVIRIRLAGTNAGPVNGMTVFGSGETIMGLSITDFEPSFDNVHHAFAIFCQATGASVSVQGDFVGVQPNGVPAANLNGVDISGGCRGTIGGTSPSVANVLSANTFESVWMAGPGDIVQGNLIGTDPAGTQGISPTSNGIDLYATTGAVVGGSTASARNIISGNSIGVVDAYSGSTGSTIQGNYIGTNAAGTAAVPNSAYGIWVAGSSTGERVVANTIANNGVGVFVGTGSCGGASGMPHVAISQNSIFSNGGAARCGPGGLGIDLAPQGTVNCSTAPPGPNDYTPCLVITAATTTHVSGTACAACTVEIFRATNEADDQAHGEGKTYLGTAVADGIGNWSITGLTLTSGQQITATATTPGSPGPAETSEFATNVAVS
ncbi:MAG: hypothetical protein ACR2GA_01575 [Chloroflexota bacterium]